MSKVSVLVGLVGSSLLLASLLVVASTYIFGYNTKAVVVTLNDSGEYWLEVALLVVGVPCALWSYWSYLRYLKGGVVVL